jgi:L-threonylcarbamoyladenylate synthase
LPSFDAHYVRVSQTMIHSGTDAAAVALAEQCIRRGELIGLPTETVYGLAANACDDAAVARIFAAKGRPDNHPLIVHVAALDAGISGVAHFCEAVPAFARQLMAAHWPGPLTLILPRRAGVANAAAAGQASIGLRCPAHPVAQALLWALQRRVQDQDPVWGLAAPSANRFGRVSPTTAAHVREELGGDLLILDGGSCAVGIESTIIDCTRGEPVLLRPGAVGALQVEQACGRRLRTSEEVGAPGPRASGTLESHYAPNARVRLMDAKALQTALDLLGRDLDDRTQARPSIALYARTPLRTRSGRIVLRRMPDDAVAAAHELFADLRALDAAGVALIWVETPPPGEQWEAVRDRLQRAAA